MPPGWRRYGRDQVRRHVDTIELLQMAAEHRHGNKSVYIALGILPDGSKEILGIWTEQTAGAEFWLRVMIELESLASRPS